MPQNLLVGIDFDNTIICYDQVFHRIALEAGLIPPDLPVGKNFIRDHLRSKDKEDLWTEMQGLVYGKEISAAEAYPGFEHFLGYCKMNNIATCIVSHKTQYPYRGPRYDLHAAGHKWLQLKGLINDARYGLSSRQVFFELTKAAKINRIASLNCTHFIDDLPEILLAEEMPAKVKKILFDPADNLKDMIDLEHKSSWTEILEFFKTEAGLN